MKIEDGKGKSGDAGVNKRQRLDVSSQSNPRIFYFSRDFGLSYVVCLEGITAAANDIVGYLKNTSSTRNLFVDDVTMGGVEAIKWKIFKATGTAAAGETTAAKAALNLSKGIVAEADIMAGNTTITGLTAGDQVGSKRSGALDSTEIDYHDSLILGPGNAIMIEYDTGTGGLCEIMFFFHHEDFDD